MDYLHRFSFRNLYASFFGSSVSIAPEYLVVTLLIAFVIYKSRRIKTGFWNWAVPKDIYRHASSMLDIKLFIIGQIMGLFGLLNKVVFATFTATTVAAMFSTNIGSRALANPFLVAAAVFIVSDFTSYWVHRFYHENPLFWPIHSVHHSAEVLTPITTYRQHPLATVISVFINSIVFGVLQGVFLGAFVTEFSVSEIAGVNVIYFGFIILVHNFHHSHIWVTFGRFWGHILISPAQHQIHHSIDPRHHDKNYGQFLAIWDWLFGTFYNPLEYEDISVGLADAKGAKLPQKHPDIVQALIVPMREIWTEAAHKYRNKSKD